MTNEWYIHQDLVNLKWEVLKIFLSRGSEVQSFIESWTIRIKKTTPIELGIFTTVVAQSTSYKY